MDKQAGNLSRHFAMDKETCPFSQAPYTLQVTKFFAAYKKAENEKREHRDRVDRQGCAVQLCVPQTLNHLPAFSGIWGQPLKLIPDGREDPPGHAQELSGGRKAGVSLRSRLSSMLERV